jgi:hypothetical protein
VIPNRDPTRSTCGIKGWLGNSGQMLAAEAQPR